MPRDRKTLLCASAAIVGAAVLACAAVVGRYHQQKTELEQFLLVPMNGPMLFSHPGGEPRRPRAFSLLLGRPAACPARLHAPCMHHDRRHQLASRARWRCVLATYESCGAGAGRLPRGITRKLCLAALRASPHPHTAGSDVAGMPGNGYSGRANNLEDYTDPYGGGDVPGPYGNVPGTAGTWCAPGMRAEMFGK